VVRSVRALVRQPRRIATQLAQTAIGAGALARAGLSPAPASPYNTQIGPDRRFTWVRASLDDLKQIKNSLGGTVNDVVLATVTGALRRHLQRRGERIDGLELKAFVPVSVRTDDQRGTLGNQVSGMIVALPVSCTDPVACLKAISEKMDSVKSSGQAVGAQALTELSGFAPPTLIHQGARLATRQRLVNLVVTNVPGPQFPLVMAGRELLDLFPMVPLGANLALGVAIVSYNGTMNFGLVGDFQALPDLEELAGDFTAALAELAQAADVSLGDQDGTTDGGLAPVVRLVPEQARPSESAAGDEAEQPSVVEPWPGYDALTVPEIAERLGKLDDATIGVVHTYETLTKARRGVLELTERQLQHS
jgi:WS/DGAT/MGAT family acyltransferase